LGSTPILIFWPLSDATVAVSWTLWASLIFLAAVVPRALIVVASGRWELPPLTETQRLKFGLAIGCFSAVALVLVADWLTRVVF
jgi:hypothetical protein